MKMIPAVITAPEQSRAEQKVFNFLRSTSLFPEGTALHSQNLNAGPTRAEAEADFVLLCSRGLLVMEVKGGGISRQAGQFYSVDAAGRTHAIQNPFRQAASALHTLEEIVQQQDPDVMRHLLYGYAVVLPDTSFDVTSAEWHRDIVIDLGDMTTQASFNAAVSRVFRHWQDYFPDRSGSPQATETIRRLLRPEFDRAPSVTTLAQDVERELHSLTREQWEFFDALLENDRILCRGGAGTGKTFLLAEAARRHAAEGRRVLVTCHSLRLARHLRGVLAPGVATVLGTGELAGHQGNYDVLLVDEGQDLMSMDEIARLDPFVEGGLLQGRWAVFYDPNLQARIHNVFRQDVEDFLQATQAVRVSLTRNCRNTAEIARRTTLRTGGDIGRAHAGAGLRVQELFYRSAHEQEELAARVISDLRADSVRSDDVILLSALPWEASVFSRLAGRHHLAPVDRQRAGDYGYCHVDDYKGLEARFVVVGDIGTAQALDALAIARLYVAMTRARAGLWLLIDETCHPALDNLAAQHMEQIVELDLKGGRT